uniref:Odorant receptor n=1 Tax=Heortia vitessoides TaxID=1557813 RepID=A0A978W723_9NEOP|nr:odorant receptor 25 [Heortia vitessoides]
MPGQLLFDKSLEKINFLYQLTGFNVCSNKKNRTFKQNCVFLFNFLWVNTDNVGALYWIINGILGGKPFTEVTFVAPCVSMTCLGIIKGVFFIINERKVSFLMEKLKALEEKRQEFGHIDDDEVIKPEIRFLEAVTKVLNVLNVLMVIVFDLCPLIVIAVKYFKTGQLELMLPFLDVYPFDSFDLRYWPFAYMHQIWSECIVLLQICAADYLFFTCCTYIRINFRLLQRQFEQVISSNSVSIVKPNKGELKARFDSLIGWHQEIISSANMLELVYSKSTLFNFLISSLVICLTGFNVTAINDVAYVMTFMIFLFMSLLQIYFLCYFGDLLMNSSVEVANAVYKSRWYLSDAGVGRSVALIQVRAQHPCKLTAAAFADVNLKAFMKILSTAWSYFALLQTIYGSHA